MAVHYSSNTQASTDFSTQHYYSADLFAKAAAELEEQENRDERGLYARHQAYTSGAVLAAVAFMEGYINELFSHCAGGLGGSSVHGLSIDERSLLGRLWKRGVPRTARFAVLDKYDIALDLLAKPPFDRGQEPFQGASALIALRNALIHFEPEFYPVPNLRGDPIPQDVLPDLEKKLHGRFALNPLAYDQFGFFPDKCLSAGGARWAVESSTSLVYAFVKRMGIVERFKDPIASIMSGHG